jgi:hypothetical protein
MTISFGPNALSGRPSECALIRTAHLKQLDAGAAAKLHHPHGDNRRAGHDARHFFSLSASNWLIVSLDGVVQQFCVESGHQEPQRSVKIGHCDSDVVPFHE